MELLVLVESFARGELAADWTNILSNPRADFRFYYGKIRGLARIGQTKNELDNADAADERFHQDHLKVSFDTTEYTSKSTESG